MLTDEQVVDQRDDGEMMRRPHLWPLNCGRRYGGCSCPFLPVKRPAGSSNEYGLMTREGGTTVFLTDLIRRDLEAERINYESVEAILADGWRVD